MGWEQFDEVCEWRRKLFATLHGEGEKNALPRAFLGRLSEIHALFNKTRRRRLHRQGVWHRIELDNVLQHNIDASQLAHAMEDRDFSWMAWLRQAGIAPSQVDAYALFCPQDPEEAAIREAMKNIYLEPYLPGSSVKGAIRTAVICRLAGEDARQNFSDALKRSGDRRKWLGQPVERVLLGRSPNYDLMRAVLGKLIQRAEAGLLRASPEEAVRLSAELNALVRFYHDRRPDARDHHLLLATVPTAQTPKTTLVEHRPA